MRWLNIFVAVAFAVFLGLPAVSLILLGYSPRAEESTKLADVDWAALIGPDDHYRSSLARSVVDNSPIGIGAISARSRLDLDVFGTVSTDQVISGNEGWLFYKPELTGACRSGAATKRVIDVADAMRVYAAGAGIELTVSVSPDKSVVYADRLGARAELIAGCKGRLAAAWRTYAQRVGSHVIDHLSDLRQVEGQIDLYYPTDTHWNDYGIAFAMRGLAQQYLGVDPGAPGASDVVSSLLATDLSRMLKYSDGDVSPTVPRYWERFEQAIGPGVAGVTVLHDSFYTKARQGLRMLFPDGTFVIRGATDDSIRLALESRPKRLLINVVERSMVLAFLHGGFAWDAALGRYVLEANAAEASACQAYAIPTSGVKTSGRRASVRIQLPEGGRPCIRITSYSALGASALRLPSVGGSFRRAGYAIPLNGDGQRQLAIALPEELAGKTVRFDRLTAGGLDGLSFAVGLMPAVD